MRDGTVSELTPIEKLGETVGISKNSAKSLPSITLTRLLQTLAITLGVAFAGIAGADDQRPWAPGNYWTITGVDVEDGAMDDYIADLKKFYRRGLEQQKKDGQVVSYTMFGNVHSRAGEADLYLMVEWKSGAKLLDTPEEYFDKQARKLFGSEDQAESASVDRGKLRTIMSTSLMREFSFSK